MLVSLIIATKNRPERLAKALSFLKKQSYQNWEALVTDDGDGRAKLLANEDIDSRIKGFANAGIAQVDARNTSVTYAKGELLALHDDDDWWEDLDHLKKVVSTFSLSSDSTSSNSTSSNSIGSNSTEVKEALLYRFGWMVHEAEGVEVSRQAFELEATPESLRTDNSLLTSSLVYPRRLHQKLGLFDRAVDGYFDWDWSLRVVKAGYPLVAIKTPGVCYLQHADNGSQRVTSERRLRNFQAFKEKHGLDIVIKNHASLLSGSESGFESDS